MKRTQRILSALLAAAMLFSLLPATAFASAGTRSDEATIDVTEYGADPTGVKESSTAVIAALAAAKELPEGTQKTIVFPKGEYHFYADYSEMRELYVSNTLRWDERAYANKYIGILVEDMKNVTIDGGGSLFIFHGNVCTMAAIDSENVTFTNFSEDFASPEVVDVTVESHDGDNAAILFIPACYNFTVSGTNINWQGEISPSTGQPYWSGNNGFLSYRQYLDTVTGRSISNGKYPFSNVSSITKIDDTHIRVVYSNADSRPPVGQCCQMRHPNPRKTPGTFFWHSKNVTVSNANFHFLHGFGMVSQLSENITLDTVKYQARPGTGRTSAGFADFVQMSSVGGNVTIRNCDFANPHDDPINIHGTFLEVKEVSNNNKTFKVRYQHSETWGFPQYYVGDKVDFSVKNTLAPVAGSERTVVSVINPGEGEGRSKSSEDDMRTIIITLDQPVEGITADNYVVENVTYTPEVLIENCRFAEVPTRGILVTTRKPVVIRNNLFNRIMSSSIFISCDAQDWRESGRTEDVLITGNTFIAENTTGNGDHYGGNGIIMIWPTNPSDDPNYQIHKNIRVEGNTFELLAMPAAKRAIVAKSVNGLTIKNNLFRRYDPNVSMTLAASAQSVAVGGSQPTSLTSSGVQYTNRLFRLQACKNITFEDNTYDNGLNLGVQLDGSVVTAADVSDRDGVLNVGGDNQLPAVGAVNYFSSNPSVATVDASGVVTGISAGTAEIYAYTAAGERVFESNHLSFTVTGGTAAVVNKIDVTGNSTVDVGGALSLSAAVDPANAGGVAWSVKPATGGAAAAITQSGVLTGTAPGVVEVTATLGGVTASKLITVNKPNFVYLSDLEWTSATTGDGTWNNGQPIKDRSWESEKGSNGVRPIALYDGTNTPLTFEKGIGTHAESVIKYNLSGMGFTTFTAQAGVSYYQHDQTANAPNLHFSVLSDGTEKVSRDSIYNVAAPAAFSVDITGTQELTLKVTSNKTGNGAYWGAHGNWADAKLITDNVAPTASGVTATAGSGNVTLNYTYSDADSDLEDGSLIAWYISDAQNGHYTRLENAGGKTLPVTADVSEKWIKAVVVPRDATGRYGTPVASAAVQAPVQVPVQDDATLRSLSVAGVALTPAFDPQTTAYTIDVPPSADKVTIAAAASQAAADVAGTGEVELTGTATTASVTVTAPDGTTTKTYTVTIRRAAGSSAELSALTATVGSSGISYVPGTRFYQITADGSASTLALAAAAADPNATIAVRFNGEEKDVYTAPMSLPLVAGLNHLELRVTAADGISTALYRVAVMKPAATDASLSSLSVNGTNVLSSMGDGEGLVRLDGDTATLNAAAADPNATVLISVDGKAVANGGSVTLTKALTTANIRVVAEDTVTEKIYTLVLTKKDPASADLAILKLGGMTLSPAFDPSVTSYTATSYGSAKAALTAAATQAGAAVTYETVAEYKSGTGQVNGDCRFFKDEGLVNKVIVTVTSPNGENTKTYTVTVDVVESAYLSDLPWTSATSGWRDVRRDYDVDPNTDNRLSLLENGQTVTYAKGLGTHANSVIEYDLSSMGFTRFTAKVGMDHSQASANTTQRLRFYVDLDGTNQYTSEQLGSTTNCGTVAIDITDAEQMTLRVIYTTSNDANAHADWADAKLSSNIPLLSETDDVFIQHIEFEHESHTLYVNENDPNHTMELHPVIKPTGVDQSARQKVLTWDSSDDSVATVNDGVVTAVAVGTAEISATAIGGATDVCTVTVKKVVEGELSVTGALKFGSTLTANVNSFDLDVRGSLTYTWYRGESASGTVLGSERTYVPVEEDIGSVLTLKVAAREDSYYEGEATFTTAEITKADGPQMRDVLRSTDVSVADAADGTITGLFKGQRYEYLLWNDEDARPGEDAVWTPFCDDTGMETPSSAPGSAVITGLSAGTYLVRRAGSSTHNPGPYRAVTIGVVGTVEYDLNNDTHFDGGDVETVRSKVAEGATVTIRVKPDTGYELDALTVTPEGGAAIIPDETSTPGTYTFTMPAANVTITATFRLKTYTITHNLANISCSLGDEENHTATHGEAFAVTLTPYEGYNMPRSLTLTETDTGRRFTDFTYEVDAADPAKRVLTFANGVTCNITASGAATLKTYTVVYELTNGITASGAPQRVTHGMELSVTLSAARGYSLPESIAVTVGGVDFDRFNYDQETGIVEIAANQINGNVVITAQGEAQGVALQSAAVVGPAQVGRTLSVNIVPVLATVDYQWILVDEDGTETPIDGAVGNRYVIPAEAEGKAIRVRVTGTGGYKGTVISDPTAAILPQSEPFVFVTSVTLGADEASVPVDGTIQIGATVEPDNATSGILYWFSSNDAIATVDQNGVVTGVAEGTAVITARSTDTVNFVSAECVVTVTEKQQVVTPPQQGPIGGGILIPPTTTTVVENPDGSTTTTVTDNRTGTVTETTENPDGSTETVETRKDGTVTATTTDPEGGKVEKITTPDEDVTITITDPEGETLAKVEIPAEIPESPIQFVDVPEGHWAESAIYQAAGMGLVQGVGGNRFNWNGNMERGDLAVILFRMSHGSEGCDLAFDDVPADAYYADGVAWAAKTGVVTGYSDTTFGPKDNITREQLAVMLYRYAQLLKLDTAASADELDAFTDGGNTSGWAVDGMAWCVENGIIKGMGNDTLAPNVYTTRAEVAIMLQRFMELMK